MINALKVIPQLHSDMYDECLHNYAVSYLLRSDTFYVVKPLSQK